MNGSVELPENEALSNVLTRGAVAVDAGKFSTNAMKPRRIVGLVLVIVAVAVLWLALRQNAAQTFTLPDGNHLYFRA